MKAFLHLRIMALVVAVTLAVCPRAGAQSIGLSVTTSTNLLITTNSSLTYNINVTNQTGLLLQNVFVTNALSEPVSWSTIYSQGSVFTNSAGIIFELGSLTNATGAQMTLAIKPTALGFLTNIVIVGSSTVANITFTNVVVQVITAQADLGVTIADPVQAVITNDWMTYGVTATNSGPNAAPNVVLTNTLPPGVALLSVSPSNQIYTVASSNLIFNLGMLANGGYTNLQFTVQPTNAGVLTLSVSIGAAGLLDTNTANNSASTNISVTNYLPGTLVAFTNSAQTTNFLNGLLEQTITVSNAGSSSVYAARVVVTGLTNRLFNAVGTNNGNPFVVYDTPPGTPLTNGQSVNLLLQYFPRKSFQFTNSQLQAFAVPVPNWTPPEVTTTSTNINIIRIVHLPNGNMLIEWPAITNRTYTVVYSDNVLFSNAMIAPPSIVAPANDVEWIDYGPPTTVSAPANASSRFYRVFLNQ
ncbi:MAG: DUF11 domain-containing protein [Verrucomicrobiota bacterium]